MTETDLKQIHERIIREIELHGGRIDRIYYCTALGNEDCNRKPNIGMALQAQEEFLDIDFNRALMIGDSESDIQFAENSGMKGIKLE